MNSIDLKKVMETPVIGCGGCCGGGGQQPPDPRRALLAVTGLVVTRQKGLETKENSVALDKLVKGVCPSTLTEFNITIRALSGSTGPVTDVASRHFTKCPELPESEFVKKNGWFW